MALNAEDALAARAILLLALAPPLKFVLPLLARLVRSASVLSLVLIVTSVCFLQTLSLLLAAMLLRFLLWLSLLLPSRARERARARYLSERARTACQGILGREVGLGVELWLGERIHARVGACTGGHV